MLLSDFVGIVVALVESDHVRFQGHSFSEKERHDLSGGEVRHAEVDDLVAVHLATLIQDLLQLNRVGLAVAVVVTERRRRSERQNPPYPGLLLRGKVRAPEAMTID